MKYTPEDITELKPNEIFVFGSNESGIHGSGAARTARELFAARYRQGFGPSGQTFAIPTKDWNIKQLSLDVIQVYVDRFLEFTTIYPEYHFLVTKIGCGLAGYTENDIAPLFKEFIGLSNISLPKEFVDVIENGPKKDVKETKFKGW